MLDYVTCDVSNVVDGYTQVQQQHGFLWVDTRLELVYEITIVGNKLRKQLTMSKNERKKIVMDESRVWDRNKTWKKDSSALDKSRISFSEGYFFFKNRIKSEFNMNGDSFDFTKLSKHEKTVKIVSYLKKFHDSKLNVRGYSHFFLFYPFSYATITFVRNNIFIVYPDRTQRICAEILSR